MPETNLTLTDRLAQSFFGGLTGAIYGVILWIFAFYFTGKSHPSVIACSAFVFASLGGGSSATLFLWLFWLCFTFYGV